jgi:protoporphyrinogen oxidase
MPLPQLIRVIDHDQVPADVLAAADELLCTSVVLVDIAVERRDLSAHHWFYVYDDEISFSRASFGHMLSPANAPEGRGAIQAEVYHSKHRPLPCAPAALPGRVIDELVAIGVLGSPAEVIWARHREIPYANVVFDHRRAPALAIIRPWVEGEGIFLAGRYGEWGYHWTDDATRSGWAAARNAVEALQT